MKWQSWWPWLPPSRGDILTILFGIVLVLVVGVFFVVGPRYGKNWSPAGFGPEWRCLYLPSSDPVCIKKN